MEKACSLESQSEVGNCDHDCPGQRIKEKSIMAKFFLNTFPSMLSITTWQSMLYCSIKKCSLSGRPWELSFHFRASRN